MTLNSLDASASKDKARTPKNGAIIALILVAVMGFTLLGSISGPGWAPTPLTASLTVQRADTSIGSRALTAPQGSYETSVEVVTIKLTDEVSVLASVYRPIGAPGKRPGMVFLHGAGTATHRQFEPHARAIASTGIVTIVPDKRLDTYTTAERDYVAMARDYRASGEYLQSLPEIDRTKVGYYGESEGAYIASIIAGSYPDSAFLILVSAPVVPPREQATYATDNYLRNTHVPEPLLTIIPRGLGPQMPGGVLSYADFDVRPYLERVKAPVFMAYGTGDTSMPIVQGAQQVIADIAKNGNSAYTVRYYANANHGIKVNQQIVPAFLRDVSRWTAGLPDTAKAEPRVAGEQPVQQFLAEPPPKPKWYADGDMIVIGLLAGPAMVVALPLLGLATGGITRLVRGRRGERAMGVSRAATWTLLRTSSAAALAAIGAWVLYIAYIVTVANLAVNYRTNALAVDGGWAVTRMAAIIAVAALIFAVRALIQTHRDPVRLPVWLAITLLGLLGGRVSGSLCVRL
ncbi:alpha/beta hydrolase family protein [Bowdeniella nasicola]|uniref:alpha/beta hydrolase family protein n=1 Tax=Bowdeniella nasicola TaxID=208480 RepID=UPI001161435E|nr:acyl-CoA thioester hydrolase/BAAT C-terminal domain-containing protein [Bowdeniella nasicola]